MTPGAKRRVAAWAVAALALAALPGANQLASMREPSADSPAEGPVEGAASPGDREHGSPSEGETADEVEPNADDAPDTAEADRGATSPTEVERGEVERGEVERGEVERGDAPTSAPRCRPEPPLDLSTVRLPLALVLLGGERPRLFGSASIGTPTRGSLWSGVELQASEHIELAGGYHWATDHVVRSLERAAREVRRCHPDAPRVVVGDLSREHGGWLRPHRSHQAGLDADVGYFYRGPSTWYQRATAANFDAERTWTLLRSLIEGGNVDTLFIDASVQRLLREHLAKLGEEARVPERLWKSPTRADAIVRHAWGHATHFHVRFVDPSASALGERLGRARLAARRY